MTYRVGTTGTRHGGTRRQLLIARDIVLRNRDEHGGVILCEGCCTGWDDQLTELLAPEEGVRICGHPPLAKRYVRTGHDALHTWTQPEEDYLARDRAIVRHGKDLLVAGPKQLRPVHHGSGTWYTIGRAAKAHRNTQVIFNNGTVHSAEHALAAYSKPGYAGSMRRGDPR